MRYLEERKRRALLDVASYLGQASIYMINLAIVYYLRYSFSLSSLAIGIAASTYTVSYFIGCLALPRFVERFRSSTAVMIAIVTLSLCAFGVISTRYVPLIYLLLILYGLSMCFLWPPMEAWITHGLEGEEMKKALGGFCFSWSFGMAVSPVFTTLFATLGIAGAFWFAIAQFILMAVLVVFVAHAKTAPRKAGQTETEEKEEKPAPLDLRLLSRTAVFLGYAVLIALQNMFPLYAAETLGKSDSWAGFMLFLRGLASCLAFVYVAKVCWWQFKLRMVQGFMVLLALLCLIPMFLSSTAAIALFFLVFGTIYVFGYEFSIFHCAVGKKDRTRAMMLHEAMISIGSVCGALIGGFLFDKAGFQAIMTALAASTVLILLATTIAGRMLMRRS